MESQPPPQTPNPTPAPPVVASQSTDNPSSSQQPPQQPPPQHPPSSLPQQQPSSSSIPNPNTNPNPTNTNTISPSFPPQQQVQPNRVPFNRPWAGSQPQPQTVSQFSHFAAPHQPAAPSAHTQRGGIAVGLPAISSQPTAPAAFSASFNPQYGAAAVPRAPVNVADTSPSPSPARPPMHGMTSMGMIGSQMRPGGAPQSALHQQRPVQASSGIRPQATSNNLPHVPQNFQGHGILRASSVAQPSTSTPSTSQSQQTPHQPWLSAQHARPPLPSQPFRPQVNAQSLQQRSHIPQQSPQPIPATSQPHQLSSSPQQQQHFPASNQSQENFGQQLPSRVPQPFGNQQPIARVQGSGNQRPPVPVVGQASIVHSGPTDRTGGVEDVESCNRILSKRSIQELVNQVDSSEKLDPEVEDVLVDIAEDFIDSVTTFGCSLAKHRKSNTLEAKDILLHLDRAWNMTLPGFSGDEIRTYKKPVVNDIHKERLAAIKRSHMGAEMVNRSSAGQAAANVKGHLAKATPNIIGS